MIDSNIKSLPRTITAIRCRYGSTTPTERIGSRYRIVRFLSK